ncbi:MAG: flagellar biosynthesis protein FlgJ [Micavibrio aeruginosavorus]|uniref:Flagellar biosynthesis protein FlgJ n=1 Tax=Micavibrio aeruginosavorus TaxID=349221 RepID=A0A2W5HIL4_9BACT|nr:MAG: flagellar biosynthesis protein FlgJ [Micavibrio aeruginosavorus]
MSDISAATSQASSALQTAQLRAAESKMANAAKSASSISDKDMKKIDKTAQDFEAVFVTEMLRPMWNMMKVSEDFGGGKGEEVFRDFTLNEYGKQIASQGGFGIATHVKEQLIRLQAETSHPGAAPEVIATIVKDAMTAN